MAYLLDIPFLKARQPTAVRHWFLSGTMPAEIAQGRNMWTSDQFTKYLEPMHGANAFRDKIQARMKQLVLYTLSACGTSSTTSQKL
jgi:hypothetical protein